MHEFVFRKVLLRQAVHVPKGVKSRVLGSISLLVENGLIFPQPVQLPVHLKGFIVRIVILTAIVGFQGLLVGIIQVVAVAKIQKSCNFITLDCSSCTRGSRLTPHWIVNYHIVGSPYGFAVNVLGLPPPFLLNLFLRRPRLLSTNSACRLSSSSRN